MVNSFLAESVGSDGYAIKGPAAAALQAGAALIALAGDQIGFTSRPVMQMPAATPTPGQVLAWNGSSWEPSSISAGTPGGTSGQLQFNNGGVFDGVSGSFVSGSNVTLAGNFCLPADKQIEFGSVGIIKQSSNLLYLQSANGIRFRNMGDTAYTSAVGESLIGTDYIQGYTAVRVGQSSGGRLLPITDGIAVYNWAQTAHGKLQANEVRIMHPSDSNYGPRLQYGHQNGINVVSSDGTFRGFIGSGYGNSNGALVGSFGAIGSETYGLWTGAAGKFRIASVPGGGTTYVEFGRDATTGAGTVASDTGLKVTNLAGSADGPLTASTGTFSGNVTTSGKYIGTGGAVSGAFLGSSASLGLEVVSSTVLLWDGSSTVYASINRSSTKGISTTTDGAFAFGTSTTNANVFGADAMLVRNATGPAVQVQAAGGLSVKNLAGTADAALTSSSIGPSSNSANFRINVPTYGATANYGELYFNTNASYHSYLNFNAGQAMVGGPNNFGMAYYNNNQFTFGFHSGARLYWSGAGAQGRMYGLWVYADQACYPSPHLAAESSSGGDVRWTITKTGNGANQTITGYTYCYAQTGIPAALDFRARSIQLGAYTDVSSSHVWNDTAITNKLLIDSTGLTVTGAAVFSGTVTSAFQTLSADPTTTDISAGNQRMVKNSTSGTLKLWANDAGTMKSVALT